MADSAIVRCTQLVVRGEIPATEGEAARSFVARLAQHHDGSLMATRPALEVLAGTGVRRRYIARAPSPVDGRLPATRAMAPSGARAAKVVAERLLRQMRRAGGADIALRNEPRVIEGDLRDLMGEPRPPPPGGMNPAEERAIVPRGTIVVPQPSRVLRPARRRRRAGGDGHAHAPLPVLPRRRGRGRDRVLYPRVDGDYGLVQPW